MMPIYHIKLHYLICISCFKKAMILRRVLSYYYVQCLSQIGYHSISLILSLTNYPTVSCERHTKNS